MAQETQYGTSGILLHRLPQPRRQTDTGKLLMQLLWIGCSHHLCHKGCIPRAGVHGREQKYMLPWIHPPYAVPAAQGRCHFQQENRGANMAS